MCPHSPPPDHAQTTTEQWGRNCRNPLLPEEDISIHQEAINRTYGEDGAKLYVSQQCPLEVTPHSLSTVMVNPMMTVWVGRVDSDVQVGLRAIVDRKGSRGHCSEESLLGKQR